MKIIRRTVTAIAFIGLLMLTFSASAAPSTALEMEEALLANIEFEAMPTNSVPYGMTLNRVSGYVSQPDPSSRNKAGLFTKKAGSSCVDIPFNGGTAGSVIYQFDIMTGAKASYPEVSIRNTSGTGARLFTADANGSLTLPDGRKAADLRPDRWYKVAVRCSYTVGRYDLMIDGKTVANRVAIPNSANLGKPTILRIQLQGDVGSSLWVDNIRIYASDSVVDKDIFVHDVYNDTVYELPDDTVEQGGGSGLYLNADFEALEEGAAPSPFSINLKDTANSFAAVALPDEGGKGVRLEKKGSGDPYGDISIKDLDSERVFLEMRVMMENQSGIALIQSKDGKNSFNRLICFQGGRITVSGTSHTVGGYDAGAWLWRQERGRGLYQ